MILPEAPDRAGNTETRFRITSRQRSTENPPQIVVVGFQARQPFVLSRTGATSQAIAPIIFGTGEADQVRLDSFFAPNGTHNVYLYQMSAPHLVGAAALLSGLIAQQGQPNAEDVTKKIKGWDENYAERFSFATEQGDLSRIQSFNLVGNIVVMIVDDLYSDRKNTVTWYREWLARLAEYYGNAGLLPDQEADIESLPPAAWLIRLLPIVDGTEQVNWVPTAIDGDVVRRYNVDSEATGQTLGGAINAFSGAYAFESNGVPYNVFSSFREFADRDSAQEFYDNIEETFRESDERIGVRRSRDDDATFPNAFAAEAFAQVLAWNPDTDVRLIGADIVVISDVLVVDLAVFARYLGAAEAFDSDDPRDFAQYDDLLDAATEILGQEPTSWERYQSPPNGASFPSVSAPGALE